MATARNRVLGPTYEPEQWRAKGLVEDTKPGVISTYSFMQDVVGNRHGDNTMHLYSTKSTGSWTGDNMVGGLGHRACANYTSNRPVPGHLSLSAPDNAADATRAAAKSNPARHHVSLPLFIYELKDIPSLVQGYGNGIISSLGSANLSWNFAIAPMISDLRSMFDFSAAFDKRRQEIDDLMKKGGLKRRIQLGKHSASEKGSYVLESYLFFATSEYTITTTRDRWAVAKWLPVASLPKGPGSRSKIEDLAYNSMLGLTAVSQIQNVWNAIPWSWLVDWFTTMGDFLAQSDNTIAYLAKPVMIMSHTHTERIDRPQNVPDWILNGSGSWNGTADTKDRYMFPPSLTVKSPFLNGKQLSILGSLYATGGGKGKGRS